MTNNDHIKSKIRTIIDFPKKGIPFRDVTTLFKDPRGLKDTIDAFVEKYIGRGIHQVIGIEARGFPLAGAVAYGIGAGFVPIRKPGKLPSLVERIEYQLEYREKDILEIHTDAIEGGQNVLILDDLLATGGTAGAACELVKRFNGNVVGCAFIVDLPGVGGRRKLESLGYRVHTLVEFSGE